MRGISGAAPTTNSREGFRSDGDVGLVVASATGYDLTYDTPHQPLHPGTLAAHPDLIDVLVEWRHL